MRLFSLQSILALLVSWLLAGIGGGAEDSPRITFQPVPDRVETGLRPFKRQIKVDPRFATELREQKNPTLGRFETALTATKADGRVDLRFSFKNVSGNVQPVVFASGQQYDFWVYNEQQEEIYRWSGDKSFISMLLERELGPEEELVFHEQWDLHDRRGNPVPPGTYTVVVGILAGSESGAIPVEERTARIVLEIGEDDIPPGKQAGAVTPAKRRT